MADIFVSCSSSDRDWAFWIAQELEKLGHVPRIAAWMEERHSRADHMLMVISNAYLNARYSSLERRAAQWASATNRPNFALLE
jgi:hypothetical protein